MKIERIQADFVRSQLGAEFRPTWNTGVVQESIAMVLVRITTDDGIVGIGAGPCSGPASARLLEEQFTWLLTGQDPFRIEEISRRMQPVVNEYAWPWCVEMAIWDILGKATGQPVWKLLGGYHTELPVYASLGERRDAETRIADLDRLKAEGFRAVKVRFRGDRIEEDLDILGTVMSAHPDITYMVDANQGHAMPGSERIFVWDVKTALRVADALLEMGVLWLEEPLPRRHYRELAELTRLSRLAIAGGELNHRISEFTTLIDNRCYDIIQADAAFSEGLWGCRKIASIAEGYGLPFVPHTWSNGAGFVANAHLAAAVPNCAWLEVPYDPPAFTHTGRDGVIRHDLKVGPDGTVTFPETPGLGISIDEEMLASLE